MIDTYFGAFIQKNRKAQGLSQEDLCEGICDATTLSRIENGERIPSRVRAISLLQRLGLSADRYYMLLNRYDAEVDALQSAIIRCSIKYERVLDEDKAAVRECAMRHLGQLEDIVKKKDRYTQQFILRSKALLGKNDGSNYSPEEQLALLTKAIRLTLPNFDLDRIDKFRYSLEEIKIISQIATTYGKAGQLKKSVRILEKLYEYVTTYNQNMQESAGQIPLVAYNYALKLSISKRFEDAVEVAEAGYLACVDCCTHPLLPGFLHILAECYHFQGEDGKSADFYLHAYHLHKVFKNEKDLRILVEEAHRYLGLTLNI